MRFYYIRKSAYCTTICTSCIPKLSCLTYILSVVHDCLTYILSVVPDTVMGFVIFRNNKMKQDEERADITLFDIPFVQKHLKEQ